MNETQPEFQPWPKLARLNRPVIVTEKLDGTNAQVFITGSGDIFAGSRTRWITPADDNYGFAKWVADNKTELLTLGPGRHFGEWWGRGIQRNYGVDYRKFSLFNVSRFARYGTTPKTITSPDPKVAPKVQTVLPACCDLVPVLAEFERFSTPRINDILSSLAVAGSVAVPGFRHPEGIVVFHPASGQCFKVTIEGDESPKSLLK